jgi:hypothetical protein
MDEVAGVVGTWSLYREEEEETVGVGWARFAGSSCTLPRLTLFPTLAMASLFVPTFWVQTKNSARKKHDTAHGGVPIRSVCPDA